MTNTELNNILAELYRLEPGLREHEPGLRRLIAKMSDLKPDTRFDPAFAARLKAQLAAEAQKNNSPSSHEKMFNLNFMDKKIYFAAGSLAVVAVVVLMATALINPPLKRSVSNDLSTRSINRLSANAFGSLAALSANSMTNAANQSAPLGLGGVGTESGALAARTQNSGGDTGVTAVSPVATDMAPAKMIAPYYAYKYVYKGDLNLEETEGAVYRRIKGDGQSGRALAGLLQGMSIPGLDLSTFSNLRATSLSLVEDRDNGLMINLDLNEDNINISENWEKWRIPERDNCGNDQSCWDRWRLQESDIPADDQLIAMANEFLGQHNISRDNYGAPQVDNAWRQIYAQSTDKVNFYVPEYASVIYPLLIDGEPVRDQSGSFTGLRVSINLLKNAADGLSGLTPYRYDSSPYQLETSAENILEAASNGGWNRGWYGGTEEIRTLELGTPERSYVQIWRYTDNRNDELLVPALVFPVLNPPTEWYYGPRYVVVPLVKEMLDELNKQPDNMPMPVDNPIIMTREAASSSPAAGQTADTPAPEPAPAITPQMLR